MPKLDAKEQSDLGRQLAKLLEPLPNDQRMLLLVAALYGEGRSQGLVAGEIVGFTERIVSIHEDGMGRSLPYIRTLVCPLCDRPMPRKVPS